MSLTEELLLNIVASRTCTFFYIEQWEKPPLSGISRWAHEKHEKLLLKAQ
jgi:hypothetical protein